MMIPDSGAFASIGIFFHRNFRWTFTGPTIFTIVGFFFLRMGNENFIQLLHLNRNIRLLKIKLAFVEANEWNGRIAIIQDTAQIIGFHQLKPTLIHVDII